MREAETTGGSRIGLLSVSSAWQGGLLTGFLWNDRWWWVGGALAYAMFLADFFLPGASGAPKTAMRPSD